MNVLIIILINYIINLKSLKSIKMKIIDIKAFPISFKVPEGTGVRLGIGLAVKRDAVLIKVSTDEGIRVGERLINEYMKVIRVYFFILFEFKEINYIF